MKAIFFVLLFAFSTLANADRIFETTDEARQRQNAERYETYKRNGDQAPLGGYQERLGDPAPRGTDRPGYIPERQNQYPSRDRIYRR